jgi:hypothetical protein
LSKGGVGELALAAYLGHSLVDGDKGADAQDCEGNLYEYKVSITNQFNFNFGARKEGFQEVIKKHFKGLAGAYCAERVGMQIVDIAYVPTEILVPALISHFESTSGRLLVKNFRMKSFSSLNEFENPLDSK